MYTTIILAAMLSTGAPRYQRVAFAPRGISYTQIQPQVMYATPGVQGQAVQVVYGSAPGFVPGTALPPGAIIIISGAAPAAATPPVTGYQPAPMYQPGYAAPRYSGGGGFATFSRGGSCSSCR